MMTKEKTSSKKALMGEPNAVSFQGCNSVESLEKSIPKPAVQLSKGKDLRESFGTQMNEPNPQMLDGVESNVPLDTTLMESVVHDIGDKDFMEKFGKQFSLPKAVKVIFTENNGKPKQAENNNDANKPKEVTEGVNINKNLPYALSTEILKLFSIKSDLRTQDIYIYGADGYYHPYSPLEFRVWLNSFAQGTSYAPKLNTSTVQEVYQRLLTAPGTQTTMDELDPNQAFVNTLSGAVNVKTGKICEPSPKNLFVNVLHGKYLGEDAPPPKRYLDWLKMIVPNAESFILLTATVSYLLSNFHQAKKFFYICGAPDSGKSSLLYLVEKLVGENMCSHIALEDLSSPHHSCELYGKKINTCGEREPGKVLKNTKVIKSVTGGDMVDANPKLKKHFKFRGKTKLVSAGNEDYSIEPQVDEEAFWSRMMPLKIPVSIPKDKQLSGFKEVLFAEERDKILTYHLTHMRPFIEGDNFLFPTYASTECLKSQIRRKLCNVREFVEVQCELGGSAWTSEDTLFKEYSEFCSKNRLPALTKILFGRRLKERYPFLQAHKGSNDHHGFIGIRLRDRK